MEGILSSFAVMFAVNIFMLSVTNFCHFLLYNLVKNLPLFIPIVSALCNCFLSLQILHIFSLKLQNHSSFLFIQVLLLTVPLASCCVLYQFLLSLFHTVVPVANISSLFVRFQACCSALQRRKACTLLLPSVTMSVTVLLSLPCFFR